MQQQGWSRREFLRTGATGVVLGVAGVAGRAQEAAAQKTEFKTVLKKALIVGKPTEDALRKMKDAGFHGVEAGIVSPEEAKAARTMAEGLGMSIHSVLRGWANFQSPDQKEIDSGIETTASALRAAQGYGADAVLLVPGRIGGMPMPAPWEFRVQFDPATGHITSVAEKDNDKYADYIKAHNQAHDGCLAAVRKLIPVAQETGVVLALENVWNNLYVDPLHFAHLVDQFANPLVKVYFDLGNHVKYAPTERWVEVLGKRLAKLHVKDFKLKPDGHDGQFVPIRDGSVNWPVVRTALEKVGYNGWMTIEGSGELSMEEQSRRLDQIIAGT